MREIVAKKYVKALVSTINSSEFSVFDSAFKELSNAFFLPKFKSIISSPEISANKKIEFVKSLVKVENKKFDDFIKVLGFAKRLDILPAISQEFSYQKALLDGVFYGKVIGQYELSPEQKSELESRLSAKFGKKIILSSQKSDYKGLKVELDDLGFEISLSLDRLKSQMSEFILKAI